MVAAFRLEDRLTDDSNGFLRHSEMGALQKWMESMGDEGAEGAEHAQQPVVSTYFAPEEGEGDGEGVHVPACESCKVVLAWFGVHDINAEEASKGDNGHRKPEG